MCEPGRMGKSIPQLLAEGRLLGTANGTEALLELVDTTLGVHELVLTGEEGVRVGGDAAGHNVVLNTIDFFLLGGGHGGAGDEAAARGDVHEHNRIVLGMDVCLHNDFGLRYRRSAQQYYRFPEQCQAVICFFYSILRHGEAIIVRKLD